MPSLWLICCCAITLLCMGNTIAFPVEGHDGKHKPDSWKSEEEYNEVEIHIPVRHDETNHQAMDDDLPWENVATSKVDDNGDASHSEPDFFPLSRQKRSTKTTDRQYRKKARRTPDLAGDVVFSARRAFRLFFDFDYSALADVDIIGAQVLLYHTRPRRASRTRKGRALEQEASSGSRLRKSARVIMHQTVDYGSDFGTTRATDVKIVEGRSRGWTSFDITPALKDWIAKSSSNQGLELWVVSSIPGRNAARVASRMRFVKPSSKRAIYRPELVVKLKQSKTNSANLTL